MTQQSNSSFNQILKLAAQVLENSPDYGIHYERTLQQAAELPTSEGFACWCVIDIVNTQGQIERAAVAHRDPGKHALAELIRTRYPASPKATRGVYRTIETGASFLIPDVAAQGGWAARADDPEHLRIIDELGSSSYLCVPLKTRGKAIGSLMLFSGVRAFDETDLELAQTLARLLAFAVDRALLYQKCEEAVRIRDEFLAQAAHELRTPLTSLYMLPKLFDKLCETGPTEENIPSLRRLIQTSSEEIVRLNGIVNEIVTRAVSRSQSMDRPTQRMIQ